MQTGKWKNERKIRKVTKANISETHMQMANKFQKDVQPS